MTTVMKEKVTVVVPVKDRERLLPRALDSVAAQSYRPIELIVVDNGSTDNTPAIARSWADKHAADDFTVKVLTEPTPGAAAARNRGLAAATAPYILFFDSDDTMRPQLITKAMKAFESSPDTQLVYWRGAYHLANGSSGSFHFTRTGRLHCQLLHSLLSTIFYMSRTDYMRGVGGWNATLHGWDDWELGIRLLLPSPVTTGLDETLVDVYAQEESITGTSFSSRHGVWERALDAAEHSILASSRPDNEYYRLLTDYRRIILAAFYRREGHPDYAHELLHKTLAKPVVTPWQRLKLRLAYRYTALGGRAAYLLFPRP